MLSVKNHTDAGEAIRARLAVGSQRASSSSVWPASSVADASISGAASLSSALESHVVEPKVIEIDTGFGKIKYYKSTNIFVAEMPWKVFKARCHLTRSAAGSTVAGDEGAGRPIGLCAAWLEHVDISMGRDFHLRLYVPELSLRTQARQRLWDKGGPATRMLFCKERKRRPGEDHEPINVC